jgi:hypothetical protein
MAAPALVVTSGIAVEQQPGRIPKIAHGDSPASMSIIEESTILSEGPMMAVFNNLVMFDQHTVMRKDQGRGPLDSRAAAAIIFLHQ